MLYDIINIKVLVKKNNKDKSNQDHLDEAVSIKTAMGYW